MGGFAADWLALREPADRRSRATSLVEAAGAWLAGHDTPHVCDLGAGTGAARRAFAPAFPESTRWSFVDNDTETLAMATATGGAGIVADLAADPAPWPADTTLVTATAFFDLASDAWIERFVAALAAARQPLLSCLTYDGRLALEPAHPADAAMIEAFNTHQRTDKGLGGPAAGPDAHGVLAARLRAAGYEVVSEDTPWALARDTDGALIREVLKGWSGAAAEIGAVAPGTASAWLEDRLRDTDGLLVGHHDLFARPLARG